MKGQLRPRPRLNRLGRLTSIRYGDPTTTPDVAFAYDIAGNRTQMTERTGTTDNRITHFGYDDQRRLTSVGFDSNGDGTVDETVRYSYDAGGNRTQMTLPGSKTITYSYDANGRLIGLRDWDDQPSDFHYDQVGRHVATQRPNGLSSDYAYDPASRLRRVRHRAGSSLRGQFNYTVDGRGNRTRAFERLAQSTTVSATLTKTDTAVTFTRGTWTDAGDFKQTAQFSGRMQIAYTGDEALLTIGTGPDHGQFDLYINDTYWRRFDAYATTPAERVIHLPQVPTPTGATSGVIEIRNRSDRHHHSTGRVFRFKQLAVIDTTYTDTTIDYTYDALSRLQQANYNTGERVYDYNFDLAGNRIQEALSGTSVTAKTTDYTYNAANQLTNDGTHTLTYDANGNLTSDGTNTYTWDRANRLTQVGNTTYTYDGLGNRVSQTVGNTVTNYLLDLQPGLTKVIGDSDGNRYVHSPRGIHAMQNNAGEWSYMAQDGLGSVRGLIDTTLGVDSVQSYNPYGVPDGNYGTGFGFTGEQTDSNGQVYLRARYYDPSIGVFNSLDPFEGLSSRPMSLNGYGYVSGNPINRRDPSGMFDWCTGEIQEGDTLGEIYSPVLDLGLEFVMELLGQENEGHPVVTKGISPSGLNQNAGEPLDPSWPPLNIHPLLLAQAEINLGISCNSIPTPPPEGSGPSSGTSAPVGAQRDLQVLTQHDPCHNEPIPTEPPPPEPFDLMDCLTKCPPSPTVKGTPERTACVAECFGKEREANPPKCPSVFSQGWKSEGYLAGLSLYGIIGGGGSVAVMTDDTDRIVIIGSLELGGGLGGKAALGARVYSQSSLDELVGVSVNASASLFIFSASGSIGGNECPEFTGSGGIQPPGIGVSVSVAGTEVIFDSNWLSDRRGGSASFG